LKGMFCIGTKLTARKRQGTIPILFGGDIQSTHQFGCSGRLCHLALFIPTRSDAGSAKED
jgi:hypothetical protein